MMGREHPMKARQVHPRARHQRRDEIVGTAFFLASHAADFVTGATLPVDGGYSIA